MTPDENRNVFFVRPSRKPVSLLQLAAAAAYTSCFAAGIHLMALYLGGSL